MGMLYTKNQIAAVSGLLVPKLDRLLAVAREGPAGKHPHNKSLLFRASALWATVLVGNAEAAGASLEVQQKLMRFGCQADIPRRLALGHRYLVAVGDDLFLARDEAEFRAKGGPAHVAFIVIDLARAWEQFEAKCPPGVGLDQARPVNAQTAPQLTEETAREQARV